MFFRGLPQSPQENTWKMLPIGLLPFSSTFFPNKYSVIMIKSRRMRWAGHVARMGKREMHVEYWLESQKERDHWEDQDVGSWTILKWILER
jgi:hypothetical protein